MQKFCDFKDNAEILIRASSKGCIKIKVAHNARPTFLCRDAESFTQNRIITCSCHALKSIGSSENVHTTNVNFNLNYVVNGF